MNQHTILIHAQHTLKPFKSLFEGFFPQAQIHYETPKTLFINIPQTEEPENPEDLYHLLLSDLEEKITLVNMPLAGSALLSNELFAKSIPALPSGYYDYETFLIEVIKHFPNIQTVIKRNIASILNPTLISNMIALGKYNLNVSNAASALYVHRNTLIYRMDSVKEKTGIDVKQFEGLMIFYLLFR